MMSFAQTKDSQGHVLVNLWKTYYKAEKADKPQDQVAALEEIKKEASAKHLAWDFYDAAQRYVDVRSSINWKDRTSLQTALSNEINGMGEPVAVYYFNRNNWSLEQADSYIESHKAELQAASNPEFYTRDGNIGRPVYSPALIKLIHNDYEYAVWSVFFGKRSTLPGKYYGDRYPESAFLEYSQAAWYSSPDTYSKMGAYVNKYKDKAVSMLGRQWRLSWELKDLRNAKGSTSVDYEALRSRCAEFEKDRARFTGNEKNIADCCSEVKGIIDELDSKDIDIEASGTEMTLLLRNVPKLTLTVRNASKTVWETGVVNKTGSYYLRDTVKVQLPAIDDDTYLVEAKAAGCEEAISYDKYTLSIAVRAINEGYGAFVADYETGRPVKKCDFALLDADGVLITSVSDVSLDGFTTLPDKIQSHLAKQSYRAMLLRASYKGGDGLVRRSNPISVRSPHPGIVSEDKDYPMRRALLLTDRGAYNPGETLRFKGILYKGTYTYELYPKGTQVEVELFDPQGNSLGVKKLRTNEFGSVDGEFSLAGSSRGGMFELRIGDSGGSITSRRVRVDEFVLPTFELIWDEDNTLYLPGDKVKVSGKVSAYSGHSLGSVRAGYDAPGFGSGPVELRPDGTFSFEIPVPVETTRYGFPVRLTIADGTGETLEFSTYKHVNYRIPLGAAMLNTVEGRYNVTSGKGYYHGENWIIRDGFARVRFETGGMVRSGLEIYYEVTDEDGKVITRGPASSGEVKDIDLKGQPSGMYRILLKASARRADGKLETNEVKHVFVKAEDADTALNMDVVSFFKELGGEDIALQFGSTDGPVWAVVELVGSGNVLLEHQIVELKGERGKAGSLRTVSYSRKDRYPDTLTLTVLFFHKGNCYDYSRTIKLPVITKTLPLSFSRFTNMARPGEQCTLVIETEPGIECAAAVFDKATEEIESNVWDKVTPYRRSEPRVYYNDVCGYCGRTYRAELYAEKAAGGRVMYKTRAVSEEAVMAEEMMMDNAAVQSASADVAPEVHVRENFDATMAWEPCLRSDRDGRIEFKVTGSDRLSTYYVQLFAHGEGMKNAVLREEMKVTLPVKVSAVQPLFLYGGDQYVARATIASTMDVPVSGKVSIRFYNGADYKTAPVIGTRSSAVTIPAGGSIPFSAAFDVPADVPVLGMLVNFVGDDASVGSDAVFVTIPVRIALQTLTEAHSAVLLAGMDREALIADLRSQFVNVDAAGLVPVERDILAMIREAIPDSVEPKSSNVIDLTEAYYSNVIARRVGAPGLPDKELASIMEKIAACQNASGGIGWFEGMESSPTVTAAILQRMAAMPEADLSSINVEAAVKYLDDSYFTRSGQPWWCGCISLEKYLQTRALYPQVPFAKPAAKVYRKFKKEVKAYLTPSGARGMNGQILAKARRLRTLQSLLTLPGGKDLARIWGLNLCRKVARSYDSDVESLLQYAVKHRCGGCYYPNAVMPWRGLLESELYAHALLCDLFTSAADWGKNAAGKPASYTDAARNTAEGIRLWIMIQKETQQWDKDAAYIEAIASVLRGTEETLATKVILLSSTFTKPFPEVKAAGNGFTVERVFLLDGKALSEGDHVKVGDRIVAKYCIWSEENRSFVRLTAPRPASMRPVEQLSGRYGWWLRPMSYGGWSFSPQGYRNVLSDKTEYWFDSYPEEHTTITEEFFVTQEGAFQMPAVEIESLYAPHYRANDNGRAPLISE